MLSLLHARNTSIAASTKHLTGGSNAVADEVVPLHFVDTTYRDLTLHHLSRYEDVLDADKLKDSLIQLIQRDGWRKLGARLRKNVGEGSDIG